MYVKRKQFLGPEQRASLIVLHEASSGPTLISNGQWAIVGQRSLSLIPSILNLWLKEVAKQIDKGLIKLSDLNKPEFQRIVKGLMRGEVECIHNWHSDVYGACFSPEDRQREIIYNTMLSLDETGTLLHRPLHSTSGAQLDSEGTPIAYAWEFTYPVLATMWLYADYVALMMRFGGHMLEYSPDTAAVSIKDRKGNLLGAVAKYHPQGIG